MTANVGDVLAGKFRVEKILGIGGMGMVVAALHLELDQRVALKFMLPEAMASPQATERFLREARAAVRLRGEHVCRVLDVGKLETGAPYIVMELMEGQDLAQLLVKRTTLSVGEAADILLQALEGIAEAHANGIVHRDLKPGNLFIATSNDGSALVKVLDFGISKSSIGGSATRTGDVMGSPAYMAPEQMVSSKDVDARADLWAVGVIGFQAVSGRLPFDGETLPALCMAVMYETAPRLDAIAPVSAGFAAVVARCLAKTREERFADVAELAAALAPFGTDAAGASSVRIARVLRRTSMPPSSDRAAAALVAPTQPPDEPTRYPGEIGRVSTFSASAAESVRATVSRPPPRRRGAVIASVAAVTLALAAIVGTAVWQRGHRAAAGSPDGSLTTTPEPRPAPASIPLDGAVLADAPGADGAVPDAATPSVEHRHSRTASPPPPLAPPPAPPPASRDVSHPEPRREDRVHPSSGSGSAAAPIYKGTKGTIITAPLDDEWGRGSQNVQR